MWCDAVTMVPWTLYQMYGDLSFLSENFAAMKKFVAARERAMEDGLVARGHEYGDWLALDREIMEEDSCFGRTDNYFLTNVLHSNTLKIVADTAKLLGEEAAEKKYRKKYETHLKKMRRAYFTQTGRLAFDTVTAQVVALHFGIVPEKYRSDLAKKLNENIKKHGTRVTTGFIGTTFLMYALADNGYFDTACKLLLNEQFPGWLYEVDMGATTVWERWNSLMPDGTPNPNGMNSYNHYAYGSVMEFVYRRIAGIEAAAPGFERRRSAPVPARGLRTCTRNTTACTAASVRDMRKRTGRSSIRQRSPKDGGVPFPAGGGARSACGGKAHLCAQTSRTGRGKTQK